MAKRKTHSAAFKAQVALAAVRGDRTMNEVAAHFGLHPTLIHGWPQKLLAGICEDSLANRLNQAFGRGQYVVGVSFHVCQ